AGVGNAEGQPGQVTHLVRGAVAPGAPRPEPLRRYPHPRRPAAILAAGRDAGLHPDQAAAPGRGEADVDIHVVDRAAPGQPLARLPGGDPAQLQRVVLVHLEQPAADARLAPHGHRTAAREVVDWPAHPPQVEFLGERGECGVRIDRHLDLRRHHAVLPRSAHRPLSRSTWALNALSCSSQCAWTRSSQARTATTDSRRSRKTRTRASRAPRSSVTIPAASSTRRCLLMVGAGTPAAAARSPARCGDRLSASTTRSRAGSASACSTAASSPPSPLAPATAPFAPRSSTMQVIISKLRNYCQEP